MATDKERLDAAANWIRQNQDKKGTPEWEKVTGAYKQLRGVQSAEPEAPDAARAAADANAKKEWEQGGFAYDLTDAVRQAFKGVPIAGGLLDEGIASVSSAFGDDYEKSLEYQRARDRFRENLNPETSTALNLVGGVGSVLAAAPLAAVPALGVNVARPLAQTAVRGAGLGGVLGAADMFTRGEDGLENRAGNAAIGGALGAVAGGAAPVIGQGVSSAYQALSNRLARSAQFGNTGLPPRVAEGLAGLLEGDDALGQALARIRQGGDDAMLVDAGPNAAGALDATIQMGGPQAVRVASGAVDQRATAAAQRMTGAANQTLGAPEGVTAQRTAIRDAARPVLDPLYRTAYATPIDYAAPEGQALANIWTRVRQPTRAAANALLQEEGLPQIADGARPTVQQIDYVARALYNFADSTEGRGVLGGLNSAGRSANALAADLRNQARLAVPSYGVALDTATDPIRRSQAVVLGSRILSPKVTRADVAEELAGMTGPERQAVRSGIRAQLDESVANVKQMASDPNIDARELKQMLQNLTSRASREKVGMVLDNPNDVLRFYREVGRAMRALELKAQVATNSRTAGRQAMAERMGDAFEPGPLGMAMQGEGPKAIKQTIQMMTGATKGQQRQAMNEHWLALSRALTGPRGRDAEALFRRLIAANRARGANALTGQRLGVAASGTVAGSTPTLRGALPF